MDAAIAKALVATVPALMLLVGSILLHLRGRTVWSLLQVLGAACFAVVVLTHVCEALQLFPSMSWGLEDSVGHYIDLWSGVLGVVMFCVGYLFYARNTRP